MNEISGNKYFETLKKLYFDERYKSSKNEYYKQWIEHKYSHSIEVANVGVDIMNNADELDYLTEQEKNVLISALLMHDAARPKEVDHITGEGIRLDHAIEAARDLLTSGEEDLAVLIPVMMHSAYNDNMIKLDDVQLNDWYEFNNLNSDEQQFVWLMREKFFDCDDNEKQLIIDAVWLVKDADKMANILEDRRMLSLERLPKILTIDDVNIKDFFDGRLIKNQNRKTYVDVIWSVGAWFNDLYYSYTKKLYAKNNVMQKLKDYALDIHNDAGEDEKKEIIKLFDRAIEFVESRSDEKNN